jgi:hypothetical protein
MTPAQRRWIVGACIGLLLVALSAHAQDRAPRLAGRPLTEALRLLQDRGLPIVFASSIVRPDLRVRVEPRATAPRLQLDEILAPHGLVAREGPGGAIQVVRGVPPPPRLLPSERARVRETAPMHAAPAMPRTYTERVTVTSPLSWWPEPGVASELQVRDGRTALLPSGLVDDPTRAVQALPRVASVNDFRSELVVRASPFRHAEMVIDGVATPWLRHTAHARGDSGSVSMLNTHVLDALTLRTGAYPRRYGDRLGPQLDLTLREGSRDRRQLRGSIGGTNATLVAEGPLGRAARGSWLAAVRQSFLEWPSERIGSRPVFGFADATAKLVFDATPRQQLSLTLLRGTARVEDDDDAPDDGLWGEGTSDASVTNVTWRSLVGSSTVVTQRAYVVGQTFLNHDRAGQPVDNGMDQEVVYRAGLTRHIRSGVMEAGTQIGRTTWRRDVRTAASWTRTGYVHLTWRVTPAVSLSPGVRVADVSHVAAPTVTRWLLGEWTIDSRWTLTAAAGLTHQAPELAYVAATRAVRLQPERARHLDVTLARALGRGLRWEATLYHRREADVLRVPDDGAPDYRNALDGNSRGLELLLERRAGRGLSGWAAYSLGGARHRDEERGEAFRADFDQRHAVTAFGAYRFADGAALGATLRAGSSIPIPGYLNRRDGRLFRGDQRNQVRLPGYARLDVRAERGFSYAGRRFVLFAELTNLMNRTNVAAASGTFAPGGEAVGFTEALLPRRATAGLQFAF